MKTVAFALVVLLLVSAAAFARAGRQGAEIAAPEPEVGVAGSVALEFGCYESNTGADIPDNSPAGVLLGPISTPPGEIIQGVELHIDMEHTWIGDLIIKLYYSVDGSRNYDADGCVLCRHGYDACLPDGCCGCGGQLAGWYSFEDSAPSIESDCVDLFPPGVYGPDDDSIGLGFFAGLPTGGSFWLHASDGAGGDVGAVHAWKVCVFGEASTPSGGGFDIKPGACPNPFNVKSQGKLPAAILGTSAFNVADIDAESVRLEGSVSPVWFGFSDVATPVDAGSDPCACNELGPDGFPDLQLKFMRQDIVDVLGDFEDGDSVVLTVSGQLLDGTSFSMSDCIVILDKGKDK